MITFKTIRPYRGLPFPVRIIRSFLVGAALFSGALAMAQDDGQQNQQQTSGRLPAWRAELPGGTYTVALRAITSVSLQEYVVDNVGRVTELNIDTSGNALARFYYVEPLTPESPMGVGQSTINKVQEMAEEAADRTGQSEVWKRVVKNYPTTTHAHTIEYRVDSREKLEKLFRSADNAFRNMRPDTVRQK